MKKKNKKHNNKKRIMSASRWSLVIILKLPDMLPSNLVLSLKMKPRKMELSSLEHNSNKTLDNMKFSGTKKKTAKILALLTLNNLIKLERRLKSSQEQNQNINSFLLLVQKREEEWLL
jgi:hypothetical protein